MMKRFLCIFTLLALFCFSISAQKFQTEELKKVAISLNNAGLIKLDGLDSLPDGFSYIKKGSNTFVIRKNDNGVICHLGIRIFPKAYRTPENTKIFDYIETALLYETYSLSENKLKFKDVKFLTGSWKNLIGISDSLAFTMTVIDNKAYQLTWSQDNKKIVNMLVPIKYDILNNTPRKELEHNFIRDLKAFKNRGATNDDIDVASLRSVKDGNDTLYVAFGKQYLQENITNSTYYRLVNDTAYVPVLDTIFPAQSMANLSLLGETPACAVLGQNSCTATMSLTAICSDGKKDTLEIKMSNLIAYSKHCGCVPYFGFESSNNGILKGALFLYNKEQGYDHIFSLECKLADLKKEQVYFTSRGYLFTPTTNVKNLYQDISRK